MFDECSQGTIAAGQCSQTLLVQRVRMMTEVPQIQFSDVRMQRREPTHQRGMRHQAKPADCVPAASRRSGTSTG